jgi:hypothetical protein
MLGQAAFRLYAARRRTATPAARNQGAAATVMEHRGPRARSARRDRAGDGVRLAKSLIIKGGSHSALVPPRGDPEPTTAKTRSTSDEYQIDRLGPFDADRWLLPKPVNRLDVLTRQAVEFLD